MFVCVVRVLDKPILQNQEDLQILQTDKIRNANQLNREKTEWLQLS